MAVNWSMLTSGVQPPKGGVIANIPAAPPDPGLAALAQLPAQLQQQAAQQLQMKAAQQTMDYNAQMQPLNIQRAQGEIANQETTGKINQYNLDAAAQKDAQTKAIRQAGIDSQQGIDLSTPEGQSKWNQETGKRLASIDPSLANQYFSNAQTIQKNIYGLQTDKANASKANLDLQNRQMDMVGGLANNMLQQQQQMAAQAAQIADPKERKAALDSNNAQLQSWYKAYYPQLVKVLPDAPPPGANINQLTTTLMAGQSVWITNHPELNKKTVPTSKQNADALTEAQDKLNSTPEGSPERAKAQQELENLQTTLRTEGGGVNRIIDGIADVGSSMIKRAKGGAAVHPQGTTKVIGNTSYVYKNGKWMQQE